MVDAPRYTGPDVRELREQYFPLMSSTRDKATEEVKIASEKVPLLTTEVADLKSSLNSAEQARTDVAKNRDEWKARAEAAEAELEEWKRKFNALSATEKLDE